MLAAIFIGATTFVALLLAAFGFYLVVLIGRKFHPNPRVRTLLRVIYLFVMIITFAISATLGVFALCWLVAIVVPPFLVSLLRWLHQETPQRSAGITPR